MSLVLSGTNGVTFPDSSLQAAAASPYVLKNRLINSAMVIDQRNAGASVTIPSATTYSLDRFYFQQSQASKYSFQQNAGSVTPPVGFTNYLGVTSSSAYSITSSDYFNLGQNIEGYNVADLDWGTANAKTITISFWVRSSLTGTFGVSLRNNDADRNYQASYTVSSANTWEQKSITVAGDTAGTWTPMTNNAGLRIGFGLGVGSNFTASAGSWGAGNKFGLTGATSVVGTSGATFYITGVQLEVGTSATPFERRLYGQELANCQRYYQLLDHLSLSAARGTTSIETSFMFPVWMRATPTIDSSVGQGYQIYDAFGNGFTQSSFNGAFAVTGATQKGGFISLGNFTGLTQGRTYVTNAANVGKFGLSAEL
jgi:hypothetical protein